MIYSYHAKTSTGVPAFNCDEGSTLKERPGFYQIADATPHKYLD